MRGGSGTKCVHMLASHEKVRLRFLDPRETFGVERSEAKERVEQLEVRLAKQQEELYAAGRNAVLIVLQGLDTAGKDSTLRRVINVMGPAGCRVEHFKEPTPLELSHDFLWRVHSVTPQLGMVGVFNRSHYEDVLIARVHGLCAQTRLGRRATTGSMSSSACSPRVGRSSSNSCSTSRRKSSGTGS